MQIAEFLKSFCLSARVICLHLWDNFCLPFSSEVFLKFSIQTSETLLEILEIHKSHIFFD